MQFGGFEIKMPPADFLYYFIFISNHNSTCKNVLLIRFLLFQIISAQQLPKVNTEKTSSIVDPQVWVEIHGVSIDNAKQKTHRIDNNGIFF